MDQACNTSSPLAGLIVQVCFPGARAAVLDNLNRQREEGRLCDLSIQVQGQVFRAHRCVLAASSPYFHDQVLLKNVTTVSLPSVMDPVAFESVLSSAYTGQLSIVHDDIVNYVTVASFLQMWHVVDKCTEILRRPRPAAAAEELAPGGAASRQQSPSSSDCLYADKEGRRKEHRKPDVLPPLATWRRPQQLPRLGRPRPSSAQRPADSRLDALPGGGEAGYSSCEEVWLPSHAKAGAFIHDAHAHNGRHQAGLPAGEALRPRARFHQRGVAPSSERLLERNREIRGGDSPQEKKREEKMAIEADEGTGEEALEKREGLVQPDFHPSRNESAEAGKVGPEEMKEQRPSGGGGAPADMPTGDLAGGGVPGPSCPALVPLTRTQWQAGPWLQGGEGEDDDGGDDEAGMDFGRLTEVSFGADAYDEIENGTGHVSQRPLVPASPGDGEFALAGAEASWASTVPTPSSSRRESPPPAAALQPSASPPTPSSSSHAGAAYAGKVHFCHCGKAYTLKSMRDRHVKMQHLNLRPFGCPVCAKSFKMKHHLTKHLKTHGGLRPYECTVCGKKVIWRDSFLRHQARCDRLAACSAAAGDNASAAAAAVAEEGYAYGFREGDAFLTPGGQVKVEEVDFRGEMEDGMQRLLGSVSGIADEADEIQSRLRNTGGQVFKEEARESYS